MTVEDYKLYAVHQAEMHGLDPQQLETVVQCESGWDMNATGKLGERGLVQIWLRKHPDITLDQALDPIFSIDFLAQNLKAHKSWWSCWHKSFGESSP